MNEFRYSVRTDLAYDEKNKDNKVLNEEVEVIDNIKVYTHVIDESTSKDICKNKGTYHTIDLTDVDIDDTATCIKLEKVFSRVLIRMIEKMNLKNKKCLVVGLGNMNVTPDALGPSVIDNIIVTRHLYELDKISEGFSNVCAISPGVMGTTGIETYDIISSVVKKIDCDFVIAVDALATSAIKRVNKTIQITNSGINPGSGVGNKRKELSKKTLGVPVIAIGVPTVVDSVTVTYDIMEQLLIHLKRINEVEFLGEFGSLDENMKRSLIKDILEPSGYNMMVTPKEIDEVIGDLTKIIANGIDLSLHEGLFNGYSE